MKANPIPNNKPFKKGQSGNPSGRPLGVLNRKTIVKKWLEIEQTTQNIITGDNETLAIYDQITLAQIKKALSGDTFAFKELMDSGFGMNKQDLNVNIPEIHVVLPKKLK